MKNRRGRGKAIKKMEIFRRLGRLLPRTGQSTKEMNWRRAQSLAFKDQKIPRGQKRAELSYKAILALLLAGEWNINQRDESTVQLHTRRLQLASPVPVTLQGGSGTGHAWHEAGNMMALFVSLCQSG